MIASAISVVEAVFRHADATPEKLCLVSEQEELSYLGFTRKIRRYARALRERGIKKADCCLVEAEQTADYLAIEMALHLLGAVFVPVEHNCAEEKQRRFAERCHAVLAITPRPWKADACAHLSYQEFFLLAEAGEEAANVSFPASEDVSEILFSTGTTGTEKGIVMTHGSSIALAENVIGGVEMQPDNIELIPSPLNHSHGLRRCYANLVMGATAVLSTGVMNMKYFFDCMDRYAVTAIDMVPTALSVLLRLSREKLGAYKNQLRYIQLGAAPLAESDMEKLCRLLPNTRLYNFYGSTESGCIVIYNFNVPNAKARCIGKPTANAEILLIDQETGSPLPAKPDVTGLLASRGAMNMREYFEAPEETAKALRDGVVYTNDLIYYDADGDIILLGRRGDVINVGGNKVAPEEIEDAAKEMPGIADCGCIPMSDPIKGECPVLFVEMEGKTKFRAVAIREWLQARLEPYKIPARIVQIDRIPRSYNGKLLRKDLRLPE